MTRAVLFDLGNTSTTSTTPGSPTASARTAIRRRARQVQEAEYQGKADGRRAVPRPRRSRQRLEPADRLRRHHPRRARRARRAPAGDRRGVPGREPRAPRCGASCTTTRPTSSPRCAPAACGSAVVSNADGRIAAALAATGLDRHFAAIIDSHVVGVEKPDPRIFHLALDACGVAPARGALRRRHLRDRRARRPQRRAWKRC